MDVITKVTDTIARMLGHGGEGAAVRSLRLASTEPGPEDDAVISTNDLGDEAPAQPAEIDEEADPMIGTLFSEPEPVSPKADEANEPDQEGGKRRKRARSRSDMPATSLWTSSTTTSSATKRK